MTTFLVIIHIMSSLILIAVVLLQSGKGAEMGVSFGATSSQTLFGSRGPGGFLSKMTIVVAALFMISALSLATLAKRGSSSSVVIPPKQESKAPAAVPGTTTTPSSLGSVDPNTQQSTSPAPVPSTAPAQPNSPNTAPVTGSQAK